MGWHYSDKEYFKTYRKIIDWGWFKDSYTFHVFMYCLARANWKDTEWQGVKLYRGQFVTSIYEIAKDTGMSVQNVRTALKHLKSTHEITQYTTRKYSVITVKNYDHYQGANTQANIELTTDRRRVSKDTLKEGAAERLEKRPAPPEEKSASVSEGSPEINPDDEYQLGGWLADYE